MSDLIYGERPELRAPRMVVAFAGWPDAAGAASRAVALLVDRLGGIRFAELPGEDFYSPLVLRPTTRIRAGRIEELTYPTGEFHYWRNPDAPSDLILFAGVEPHFQWRRYVGAILEVARGHGVTALYALGGLYDNVPHTRPVRISAVAEDSELRQALAAAGVVFADYEGPSSLHSTLAVEARARQVPVVSLWGHAPAYAQLSWSPRVTLALLELLGGILGIAPDLEEVRAAATYLDESLDKLAAQNPQVRALIRKLEQGYGPEETRRPAETPEVHPSILREVEEILRRHEADAGGQEDAGDQGGDEEPGAETEGG